MYRGGKSLPNTHLRVPLHWGKFSKSIFPSKNVSLHLPGHSLSEIYSGLLATTETLSWKAKDPVVAQFSDFLAGQDTCSFGGW